MAGNAIANNLADKKLTRLAGGHCRIDPGAPAIVILRCLGRKLDARFVGTDGEGILVFRLPVVPRMKERLLIDNGVVVKYERQGCVYQFQSHVMRFIYRPVPMLFVAMPTSIFRIDMRTAPRVSCMLPMTLHGNLGDHEGVICDLSEQGILAKFKISNSTQLRKATPGAKFFAAFNLGASGVVTAGTTIRRVESGMNSVSLGMRISEIGQDESQAIKDYIDKVIGILN